MNKKRLVGQFSSVEVTDAWLAELAPGGLNSQMIHEICRCGHPAAKHSANPGNGLCLYKTCECTSPDSVIAVSNAKAFRFSTPRGGVGIRHPLGKGVEELHRNGLNFVQLKDLSCDFCGEYTNHIDVCTVNEKPVGADYSIRASRFTCQNCGIHTFGYGAS